MAAPRSNGPPFFYRCGALCPKTADAALEFPVARLLGTLHVGDQCKPGGKHDPIRRGIMIHFDNVSKVYSTRRGDVRALDAVTLAIDKGRYAAVWGPSGCGKSTLLSLVGGLALPTSGTVTVDGFVVSKASSARRAQFRSTDVGYVFQMFHLMPFLTVRDNVLVAAPGAADKNTRSRAESLLERLGLQDRLHHRPGQLSAGERQRVALQLVRCSIAPRSCWPTSRREISIPETLPLYWSKSASFTKKVVPSCWSRTNSRPLPERKRRSFWNKAA